MFLDLYIALDLKFNPTDTSHFENNFKRTINCPVLGLIRMSLVYATGLWSQTRNNFAWLEPEPKIF